MRGIDAGKQELVDAALRDADGTPSLSRLGSDAVLAVSVASVLAAAAAAGQPRYRAAAPENSTAILPLPMINIISGGAHTGRSLDIQDLLVLPVGAEVRRGDRNGVAGAPWHGGGARRATCQSSVMAIYLSTLLRTLDVDAWCRSAAARASWTPLVGEQARPCPRLRDR